MHFRRVCCEWHHPVCWVLTHKNDCLATLPTVHSVLFLRRHVYAFSRAYRFLRRSQQRSYEFAYSWFTFFLNATSFRIPRFACKRFLLTCFAYYAFSCPDLGRSVLGMAHYKCFIQVSRGTVWGSLDIAASHNKIHFVPIYPAVH